MKKTLLSLAVASAVSTTLFADAQTDELKAQLKAMTERLDKMEAKNTSTEEKADSLLQEVADSKVSDSFGEYNGQSYAGMAPGASKVYTNKNKLSIGGYGEVTYKNYRDQGTDSNGDTRDMSDSHKAVLYFGYRFTDNIILNSEIEFEHGGNETEVEMLALDFLVNDALNFRVGTYVLPVGLVNVNHEPTLFNTVSVPTTEHDIIPGTWFENGAMVYGSFADDMVSYKTGIVTGMNATKGTTIRGMRSEGKESAANDAAYYLRLDVEPNENIALGASYYYSNAGQGKVGYGDVDLTLYEVHATAKFSGFEAKALYAAHQIGDAKAVATLGSADATKDAFGYYANLNYTYGEWVPFAQYEVSNQFDKGVDATGTEFSYGDTKETTFGINWKPHPQVVLKADYVLAQTGVKGGGDVDDDRFELGMGFVF